MTTIAFRDSILAADRLAYLGRGEPSFATKTKIHAYYRNYGGMNDVRHLVGVSSSTVGATTHLVEWIKDGATPGAEGLVTPSEFEAIVVRGGSIDYYNDGFWPSPIICEFFAIGSGSTFALGAMAMGATAEEAVKVAARFDPFTNNEVDTLKARL